MSDMGAFSSKLDISRVIQRTTELARSDFSLNFGLAAALVGLPNAIQNLTQQQRLDPSHPVSAIQIFVFLASVVAGVIFECAAIQGYLRRLDGQDTPAAERLATGVRLFFPLLILSILAGVAICAGLVALVVPGLMMACAWAVAVPVFIAERPAGLLAPFRRSAELTRGSRWGVLGAFAVFVGVALAGGLVLGMISGLLLVVAGFAAIPAMAVLSGLLGSLFAVAGAALTTSIYSELKRPLTAGAVMAEILN